jgi:hypothetical protein
MMFPTDAGNRALADRVLGRECVRHALMFFGRPDFNLESASVGKFAIAPSEPMLSGLRRDYEAMTGMIFGPVPAFDAVMASIKLLESHLRTSA